jgi:MATE family multidrug resistance protein
LGLTGAGVATFLSRTVTLLAIWGYLRQSKTLAPSRPRQWLIPLQRKESGELIRMATPISGQMLMEFGAFATATLLVGQFGSVSLAAHHIALTCAATTFMVPLGLAMALTIRVGHTLGSGEPDRCRRVIIGAYVSAFLFMCSAAAFFIFGREWIAHGFTRDPQVIELTLTLLLITAVFQIFDGGQIISMGALRGLKDVNIPTALVFACCWLFGLPLGVWLAFFQGGEAIGQWWGLALGLALTAAMLTLRLIHRMDRFGDLAAHTPEPDNVV